MIQFIKRLLVFCSPFIFLVLIYIITDPFMVIYNYDDYNRKLYVQKNRDYVSSEMLLKNSKKYLYDSFIFGSSTALYLPPSLWTNYIKTENRIFTFDASGENIIGVWSKVKYLDSHNYHIRNALVVLDFNMFNKFVNDDPTYMKHYKIYPSSEFLFQYKYFLQFLNLEFLPALAHYAIGGRFYDYMGRALIPYSYSYDVVTNEYYNTGINELLKADSLGYYRERINKFGVRSGRYTEEREIITKEHLQILNSIKTVFVKHASHYKIIIVPEYNQIAFSRNDILSLKEIFGSENVFDFSGINRFSNVQSNFYDEIHFKKYVGKELLDSVYVRPVE